MNFLELRKGEVRRIPLLERWVNRVGDARDSPTEQHRDPGTKQLRHELEGIGLTTNQKVAGSSPAERAVEGPTKVAFLFMWQLLM